MPGPYGTGGALTGPRRRRARRTRTTRPASQHDIGAPLRRLVQRGNDARLGDGVHAPVARGALPADGRRQVLELARVRIRGLHLDGLGVAVAAQLDERRAAGPRVGEEKDAVGADDLELRPGRQVEAAVEAPERAAGELG